LELEWEKMTAGFEGMAVFLLSLKKRPIMIADDIGGPPAVDMRSKKIMMSVQIPKWQKWGIRLVRRRGQARLASEMQCYFFDRRAFRQVQGNVPSESRRLDVVARPFQTKKLIVKMNLEALIKRDERTRN
jgi:hypothetical protein